MAARCHPRPKAPSSAGDPRKMANSCWLVGAGSHPAETPGGAVFGGETRSFKGLLVKGWRFKRTLGKGTQVQTQGHVSGFFKNQNGFENFEINKAQQHAQENACM